VVRQFNTTGIILARTNFGEADRIITFLTPDHGKVRALAKAVRKAQSKLAGGIELFSVSDLTLIAGRGEINTLISTRLVKHYGNIVKDLDRTTQAYEFIGLINKVTEDQTEAEYFNLLKAGLAYLDDLELAAQLVSLWFSMQLLKLTGHAPNLKSDTQGHNLSQSQTYNFHLDEMRFIASPTGQFTAAHIKFLRLGFGRHTPRVLQRIKSLPELLDFCQPLVQSMLQNFGRV